MFPFNGTMRQCAKAWLAKGFPKWFTAWTSIRARRHNQKYYSTSGLAQLGRSIAKEHGMFVKTGPFQGLRLPEDALREHLSPFLLGCYEMELHPVLEEIIRWRPACCVDIGSKFGYYAVGLAVRLGGVRTIAFDTDPWARRTTEKMADLNHVAVETRSFCDRNWLLQQLPARSFILSDCEGFETELFSGPMNERAAESCFVVETHDHAIAGAKEIVRSALASTHEVREIVPHDTDGRDVTVCGPAEIADARSVMDFRPPGQRWLAAYPRGFCHGRP